MVLPKSKKTVGLGNALMNDRFGNGKGKDQYRSGITRKNHATGEEYITNDRADAAWVKMRSITEQGALDEFLSTAEYAGTNFKAAKMNNSQIIHTNQKNPYLLTEVEESHRLKLQSMNRERLAVPRRPKWDTTMTAAELDKLERESFLVWRRSLAYLQENADLLLTPFERNLEVWRQLWRVIERSDLVVQIVDARNPLVFRSEDLDDYVKEVDPAKESLLLINKADMMTDRQRRAWAAHLTEKKIAYKFFSARMAKEQNELRMADEEAEEARQNAADGARPRAATATKQESGNEETNNKTDDKAASSDGLDTRILSVDELEELFLKHAPKTDDPKRKFKVGLVGYPNVGKSSTINALIGAKKVSVSSTPGKTKHFQTIELSPRVTLCDCPGLVFPNFATTKADLVCNGILPIDQLREFTGPAALVATRIPKAFLEAVYGIHIRTRNISEGGDGNVTAEDLLMAYARARGFTKTGQGQPDESRAARYILKDYVNGKLLFVAPPPGHGIDPMSFNSELYDDEHLPEKRQQAMAAAAAAEEAAEQRQGPSSGDAYVLNRKRLSKKNAKTAGPNAWEFEEDEESDYYTSDEEDDDEDVDDSANDDVEDGSPMQVETSLPIRETPSAKSRNLDKAFFRESAPQNRGIVSRPFNYKYTQQGQAAAAAAGAAIDAEAADAAALGETVAGKQLSGRKARTMDALARGLDAEDARIASKSVLGTKKHFKGGQRGKGKKKMPSNAVDAWE
ncbi:MAG: hypothetical protein SEPTF4163_000933 [Sporothrix epigloea]